RRRCPALRIVMEHSTTRDGADYVRENAGRLAATITAHHLMINRSHIFRGGIRPHLYCLPIAKREEHRLALRKAATSGLSCYFLGTDTAPHAVHTKEAECGCAGIFTAPVALACLAQVFDEENALGQLEAFASRNGPAFYRLPPNEGKITLIRRPPEENTLADIVTAEKDRVRVFRPDEGLRWSVAGA